MIPITPIGTMIFSIVLTFRVQLFLPVGQLVSPKVAVRRIFSCNLSVPSLSNPPMSNDTTLVSQILRGNARAFRQLVQQHERLVWHMVSRIVDRTEDVEDVCQDVFLRVYQKLPTFHFQSKLSTWIATIAYRTAINHAQKEQKRPTESLDQAAATAQEGTNAHEQLEKKTVRAYVHEQIKELPVHYRTVLTLFHLEEMSLAEIQEVTGMPTGTIKNYLFRARKLLKDRLQQRFLTEELL